MNYADLVAHLFPGAVLESATRLAGGVSADVHRLDLIRADGAAARVVLRAHGETHSGHPAELEFRLLQALQGAGIPVPEPLLVDVSGELLADPFLIMRFVDGSSAIPDDVVPARITALADMLARIHGLPLAGLPELPERRDPLPELFDFLPPDAEWRDLRAHLQHRQHRADSAWTAPPCLLHGDFWPENVLWRDGRIAAVLDWEDAAIGDPLSDVACSRLELRYLFGRGAMSRFTEAYAAHRPVDPARLALWQVYVAAAAHRFMGQWGLPAEREAHMRREALASMREAAASVLRRPRPGA